MPERIPAAGALVDAAKAALGVGSDDDLGYELRRRYGVKGGQSAVNRWRNGRRGPSYAPTMALLLAAGWLSEETVMGAAATVDAKQEAAAVEEETLPLRQPDQGRPEFGRETA